MIYRKRAKKSGYSLGFTKGRQFIKVEFGKRVWYIQYGLPVFYTLSDIRDIQDNWGQYTIVSHLARKARVTVDRYKVAYRDDKQELSYLMRILGQAGI